MTRKGFVELLFWALLAVFVFFALQSAHGQSDNSIHVKEFPGHDVGTKVANAQATCQGNAPCILVVDASLAAFPPGVMPALCQKCSLADYRSGATGLAGVSSDGKNGIAVVGAVGVGATSPSAALPGCVYNPQVGADVRCYGAKLDGSTNDATALQAAENALPETGGTIIIPDSAAGMSIASKVIVTVPTIFRIGAVTITVSGVAALQSPFGANFYVTAPNTWFVGRKGFTKIKAGNGSQADLIVFMNSAYSGGVDGIELDGNKANNSGLIDDTFGVAIFWDFTSAGGSTKDAAITIRDCDIHDFVSYGISTYGEWSGGSLIVGNRVHDNGKADDNLSVGVGIEINRGTSRTLTQGNWVFNNKLHGIELISAGMPQTDNEVTENWVYSNLGNGIYQHEEAIFSSVSGVGQSNAVLAGNHVYSNAEMGIRLGVFDVGFIANTIIAENDLHDNGGEGIMVFPSMEAPNSISETLLTHNQVLNNGASGGYVGIGIGSDVMDAVANGNIVLGNIGGQIFDGGTRTIDFCNKLDTTTGNCSVRETFLGGSIVATSGSTVQGSYALKPDQNVALTAITVKFSTQATCTTAPTVGLYDLDSATYTPLGTLSNGVAYQTVTGTITPPPGDTLAFAIQSGTGACSVYPSATVAGQLKAAGMQ